MQASSARLPASGARSPTFAANSSARRDVLAPESRSSRRGLPDPASEARRSGRAAFTAPGTGVHARRGRRDRARALRRLQAAAGVRRDDRRDVDRRAGHLSVVRTVSDGELVELGKTSRSRRPVPLSRRALAALDRLPARLDTTLLFPRAAGGPVNANNWHRREWRPAIGASGVATPARPYDLRSTFASYALAGGVSIFQLSRVMGTGVAIIERPLRRASRRYRRRNRRTARRARGRARAGRPVTARHSLMPQTSRGRLTERSGPFGTNGARTRSVTGGSSSDVRDVPGRIPAGMAF